MALEAIENEQTLWEIGAEHGVHPTLVVTWKRAAIHWMTGTFAPGAGPAELSRLHAKIGELLMGHDLFGDSFRPISVVRRRGLGGMMRSQGLAYQALRPDRRPDFRRFFRCARNSRGSLTFTQLLGPSGP